MIISLTLLFRLFLYLYLHQHSLTAFITISTSANTLLVPSEYSTIQLAIHRCNNGDTIIVSPGTYLENINFLGKNIVLTSIDPQNPEIVSSTIINGYGSGSAVSFINNESRNAVITGFTISGGYGTINPEIQEGIYWGAGIYCFNSSPTIKGNIISNNNGPMKVENNQLVALSYGVGISSLFPLHSLLRQVDCFRFSWDHCYWQ